AGAPACPGCGRAYTSRDGVWNLLPAALGAHQAAEDALHAEAGLPTWRRLIDHKRYWLEWCETRWLPELIGPRTRTFLEIGGGLCYASALAKARAPAEVPPVGGAPARGGPGGEHRARAGLATARAAAPACRQRRARHPRRAPRHPIPMKIVFTTEYFHPFTPGGTATSLRLLAAAL